MRHLWPEFGRVDSAKVDKPWGYELRWAITDRYLGKVLHIKKGEALSLQYHERKDEYLYVMKGASDMTLGGAAGELTTHRRKAGETRHITPWTLHRPTAVEDTDISDSSPRAVDD